MKKLSDGTTLIAVDRRPNDRADEQAKIATAATRVPEEIRSDFDDYRQNVEDACTWLGMVTWLAGNLPGRPNETQEPLRSKPFSAEEGKKHSSRIGGANPQSACRLTEAICL
jgi:hypothetical protein